jgi:hypothetical protein
MSRFRFRHVSTRQVVPARRIKHPIEDAGVTTEMFEPDVPGEIVRSDWEPGVIGPTGIFHPSDHSVSFVLKFPPETTAQLDRLIQESGGDATELFKQAIALYKLAKEAVREGKAVGIASSPDCLETQFVGL